jgi:hypothetical protein
MCTAYGRQGQFNFIGYCGTGKEEKAKRGESLKRVSVSDTATEPSNAHLYIPCKRLLAARNVGFSSG